MTNQDDYDPSKAGWIDAEREARLKADGLMAEIERLQAAALAFLLEQTDENAKALADVLGWKPKTA